MEYAADLPSTRYGSAFPIVHKNKMDDIQSIDDERIHPFNLNNLIHAPNSLFQILTRKFENISGITSPWVYAGMLFASFCWHVEDLYMYSVNYMHQGAAKTWFLMYWSHINVLGIAYLLVTRRNSNKLSRKNTVNYLSFTLSSYTTLS